MVPEFALHTGGIRSLATAICSHVHWLDFLAFPVTDLAVVLRKPGEEEKYEMYSDDCRFPALVDDVPVFWSGPRTSAVVIRRPKGPIKRKSGKNGCSEPEDGVSGGEKMGLVTGQWAFMREKRQTGRKNRNLRKLGTSCPMRQD